VKILVTCKRVPNPEHKLKIGGGKLDLAAASWQVNTFDEYAVETALRLTEKGKGGERSGEVVAVSIGPKEVGQQLRGVDQRSRDVERSLQSIGQSERNLRDMVRRHPEDGVEQELDAVAAGGRRLRELKGRLEARRVVLQAQLEMARAGFPDEIDGEAEGRASPVDALSAAALPVRDY